MKKIILILTILTPFILNAGESIWIEAEHLRGVQGSCFPDMGHTNATAWALSGPGIAPEWTQGGESEWLSIACVPDDDHSTATCTVEIPEAGEWRVWVRYRDWRDQTEKIGVKLEQNGAVAGDFVFGEKPVVDENDEMKLLWKWAFGWDVRNVKLAKGQAKLTLLAREKQAGHRQVDAFCLTTDASYRPYHREKPQRAIGKVLDEIRANPVVAPKPLAVRAEDFKPPKISTFHDKGFLYLWNMGDPWLDDLGSKDPKRMLVPYLVEPAVMKEFHETYGGKSDVPIFSDPRITPAFHGAGPTILTNANFTAWLDAHPERPWANMMNYAPAIPLSVAAKAAWEKYKGRYAGNISGESLGNFTYDAAKMNERLKSAKTRAEAFKIVSDTYQAAIADKQKTIFGLPIERPYQLTIPCQAVEMMCFSHAARDWGAVTVGYENGAVAPSLAMRMAFLRGGARQYGGLFATYRSCNFGDSATLFTEQFLYAHPKYVYDNYYDAWAGAGMTWYKFDIWHQYMSGSAMFYHEQGFDEFWNPGGGSTPRKPLQLSPKGRLVDQFLKISAKHPDRGTPFTPVAFLLDEAHGWDPNAYQPGYFGIEPAVNPDVLAFDRHAAMLKEWFRVAYDPYTRKEAEVNNGVNQVFIPGVFGDIFDVLVTSPTSMDAVENYPVVVMNGQVTLSDAWGKKLAQYMEKGGVLIVSADQVSGPGAAALKLPKAGAAVEDVAFRWAPSDKEIASQRFRYMPISEGEPLVKSSKGETIAASLDRGKGKLVYLSVPLGLGIDETAMPAVALILAQSRQGLMPVEVHGDVEWLLNKTGKGWVVTLLNPAGCNKQQHGMSATSYKEERAVKIVSRETVKKAVEWFDESNLTVSQENGQSVVTLTVPAAGIRIVELEK